MKTINLFLSRCIARVINTPHAFVVFLNRLVKKTNWWNNCFIYNSNYLPAPLFRRSFKRNYSSLCVGSLSAIFSIDIDGCMNLANGRADISLCFNILKFYHSYLKKEGVFIISMSPWEILDSSNLTLHDYIRFVINLPEEEKNKVGDYYRPLVLMLDNKQLPNGLIEYVQNPVRHAFLKSLKSLVYDEKKDVRKFVEKQEFPHSFLNMKAKRTVLQTLSNSQYNKIESQLNDINKFCDERSYKFILLINPIINVLQDKLPKNWLAFVEKLKNNISVIDFSSDQILSDETLYQGLYYFNTQGKKLYSERINEQLLKMGNQDDSVV